jgi:hypothetical protein
MTRNAKIRNNADRGPGNLRKGTRHRTGAIRRTRASRPTRVALIAVAALLTARGDGMRIQYSRHPLL